MTQNDLQLLCTDAGEDLKLLHAGNCDGTFDMSLRQDPFIPKTGNNIKATQHNTTSHLTWLVLHTVCCY